ncbi:MAG: hypothetical protein HY260_22135 [Chloroflexi bacterium]|nr:hypothetical protein [Chloroflexota bacterium]
MTDVVADTFSRRLSVMISRVRATVLSMMSQSDAFGQIAGGPAIGAVETIFSLRAAMAVTGALLSPITLIYARAIRRGTLSTAPAGKEVIVTE